MAKRKTKRKKRLSFAIISSSIFIVILLSLFFYKSRTKKTYIPGEKIEGLTSDLARDLPENYPKVTFSDVTKEAGIKFNHFIGERTIQLPEDMGSGGAWGDYDNDGDLDIAVANNGENVNEQCDIYQNTNGVFSNINAGIPGLSKGSAVWGDYDNDG
ncbi:MAG: VCBS repeat-containing protein, partial [Cyclobacteriaceae bacterium]|nr:VCBS repeat-containing protein [Cyclobacteriaceae bacterium]